MFSWLSSVTGVGSASPADEDRGDEAGAAAAGGGGGGGGGGVSSDGELPPQPSTPMTPGSDMSGQMAGMLGRAQLLEFFQQNMELFDVPEVKKRLSDAVRAGRDPAAVTTELQEELLMAMGIEPKFGIECLGRVSFCFKDDREVMLKLYELMAKEELACDEAELGPKAFAEKMEQMRKAQEQQMVLLKQLQKQPIEAQREFLSSLYSQSQVRNPQGEATMTSQEIWDFFQEQHRQRQPHQPQHAGRQPNEQQFNSGLRQGPGAELHQRC
ncbi:hypothetical protein CBR_g762 [Chara braunii]|uniref:Uncharacterized protein n=1 Tax=Chara braunii TaxID=69332 RepID=A0A388KCG3_CHABU|nr:hypothetical protein CBR_g762 [Chara braunii]|eukprot:GBG67633.1 hypothetical protein CBR_g762 [Chara braunii]